ncbi:MAG: RNA polymerase factor sigma-54 [Spirochaetota bacterium]|nr:RNA polymerase factor sigma-54 [Spirochaetota bacterium]
MAISLKTGLRQTQRLTITQSLIQSIELLQLTALELADKISNELLENPVLEEQNIRATSSKSQEETVLASRLEQELSGDESINQRREEQKTNYENFSDNGFSSSFNDNDKKQRFIENVIQEKETLKQHLLLQARLIGKDGSDLALLENIITSIDDNGFLIIDVEVIAKENKRSVNEVKKAISTISAFDPIGCGTRNIQESLVVQAELLYPKDNLLKSMLKEQFTLLENLDYKKIAKNLGVSFNDVIQKSSLIHNLNPFPGGQFSTKEIRYIIPEVEVKLIDDNIIINLNDDWIPNIGINTYYSNLYRKKNTDKEVKEYLQNKIQSAKNLMKNISTRRDTISKVVTAIMEQQKDFLFNGVGHLKPLTISQIAESVNLHESTVSRVVNGKFVQTDWGIYELKYFFVSKLKSLNDEEHSSEEVMAKIKQIINNENPVKTLTDEEILNELKKTGIQIARRTISKYREVLNIPSSVKRKRLNMMNSER